MGPVREGKNKASTLLTQEKFECLSLNGMNQSNKLFDAWKSAIHDELGSAVSLNKVDLVAGGSISEARTLHTSKGIFFAKLYDAHHAQGMFACEERGLRFLKEHSEFAIPSPVVVGITGEFQWIIMEHVPGGTRAHDFWPTYGHRLALMHRQSADFFGLEYDNYLGSLVQSNGRYDAWPDFFREKRLMPQIELAKAKGKCSEQMERGFEKLFKKLDGFFPKEAPAALHGDMWSGNFMTNSSGEAVIFDPAVYYGHREMDLAMTKLFGGFDEAFYQAYHEAYPFEHGWEERIEVANLYPLMAHVNLFGGSYVSEVVALLRKHT